MAIGDELAPSRDREFCVGSRTLRVSECFDIYWRFAAERQRVFHARASGASPPWTTDPVIVHHKFTNVYRAADRVSQYLIRDVIYIGSQNTNELTFRILLFKIFNKISTWGMLTDGLGTSPTWENYCFTTYNRILSAAMNRGERIYSAAYIVPNPPFGETRKHANHLRLIERIMASGLPESLANAANLREVYERLLALPSLGPFLAYQYAIDLAYSPVVNADEMEFVVPGPGALDGISKCFLDTADLKPAEVIAWMAATSREHFERLGLHFTDLWGRWPTLIDWQNVLCEVSKYTRASHPHVKGVSGRTRIKQEFRPVTGPIDYRFPSKWGLPVERTARQALHMTGGQNSSVRSCRSPTSTPPPCCHKESMQPRPMVIARSHSGRVQEETSSA